MNVELIRPFSPLILKAELPTETVNLLNQDCPIITNDVEVNILENKDNFSHQDWKSLYKISEETFVEETDSLKHGAAGAGLTDND